MQAVMKQCFLPKLENKAGTLSKRLSVYLHAEQKDLGNGNGTGNAARDGT